MAPAFWLLRSGFCRRLPDDAALAPHNVARAAANFSTLQSQQSVPSREVPAERQLFRTDFRFAPSLPQRPGQQHLRHGVSAVAAKAPRPATNLIRRRKVPRFG